MIDSVLIDLMSDLDVSLLSDDYMEVDLKKQQSIFATYVTKRINFKRDHKFEISDSLRLAVMEQKERNDIPEIREKIDIKVGAIRNKFKFMMQIVSWVAAMVVLLISIVFIRKKKQFKIAS